MLFRNYIPKQEHMVNNIRIYYSIKYIILYYLLPIQYQFETLTILKFLG